MFKIGRIVNSGCQYDNGWIANRPGRQSNQVLMKNIGIFGYRPDIISWQKIGKQALADLSVFEHVAYTAWSAQVIFKDVKSTIIISDQIDSGYMYINIMWNRKSMHFPQIVRTAIDHFKWYNTIL